MQRYRGIQMVGILKSLGYVLDKICGLRGPDGPVGLYKNQALVLVVEPGADAKKV